MSKRVPRRLKRFYRQNEKMDNDYEDDYDNYENDSPREKKSSRNKNEDDSSRIPTMNYEDLNIDNKNLHELKKVEQITLEEKVAMLELKKFKDKNKRLPNKNEAEQLAGSLYTQFKENPVRGGEFSFAKAGEEEEDTGSRHRSHRQRRHEESAEDSGEKKSRRSHRRKRNEKEENNIEAPPARAQGQNIKDLLGDGNESVGKQKIDKDEFDLGLEDDESFSSGTDSDLDDLEKLAGMGPSARKKIKKKK
jgi:hypothetical protein